MALDLSTLTAQQQLAAIYIGYYDRAADPVGEDFWESAVANPNLSLADIATDFATQPETLIAYPFLDDPTVEEAEGFIAEVFLNLFNRAPDQAGLDFWSDALVGAINGTNSLSVGEIILSIIGGAQNTAEGNDLTTILNKIEVATAWTDAAEAAEIDYTSNTAAQNSAKSIIEGVTDDGATVTAAKSTIDAFFDDGVEVDGDTILLTSATDVETGTDDNDEFLGYIQQNPFAGGISNSLSSADRLDGGAGSDRLYAELTKEFAGVTSSNESSSRTDISPRLKNIEEIDLEARDDTEDGENPLDTIIVDAKNITDHEEIGSYYSDGDLKIENLTTLTSSGNARNTSEITVTMDHTDNFNTDGDASDLEVLFDNDYLLSGQEQQGQIFYFLLDEDAELEGNTNRLNNIDVDGIRFTIDTGSGPVDVTIEDIAANVAGTHQGFVNALQPRLQELIADGTLPAGTTLTLDPTITDTTFLDDGSESETIPAIVLTSGDGSEVIATGFTRIEEPIGEYDVYGRFRSVNEVEDQPISVDLDLHKAGRGGEGGDVVIGGKFSNNVDDSDDVSIADGVNVINVNVKGAGDNDPDGGMTKPSNVGTITSTGLELREVIIATDPMFASGSTFASLTVRNGFDQDTSNDVESGDLQLVNADAFLGDLTLGDTDAINNAGRVTNADTITAQGGGDVTLGLRYDGTEVAQAYSVTTGGGDDVVDAILSGDALDYAGSSLNISTGAGNDAITVDFVLTEDSAGDDSDNESSEQLNQAILDNVEIDGGAGDDVIDVDGVGNANIMGGAGNDVIYTDGDAELVIISEEIVDDNGTPDDPTDDIITPAVIQPADKAVWAFNFDAERVADGTSDDGIGGFAPDELPGEQLSLAYIGGATVTVTLSGAGIGGTLAAGGGVMAEDNDDDDGAVAFADGYEASVEINELLNGNEYFGTQADINAAVMEAINDDPILSNLLSVSMGPNNTLIIASKTSGAFDASDLRIDIAQRDFGDGDADWGDVEDEAQAIFRNSEIEIDELAETNVNGAARYGAADLTNSATADAWYDGLSVAGFVNSTTDAVGELESNLHTQGTASQSETDNVINGGAGDDLIVLSTDAVEADIPALTVSSNNALINGASNETIVLSGSNFGNDTVMNFTTAGGDGTPATDDDSDTGYGAEDTHEGLDFLDFTAYLTSQTSSSTSSVSEVEIPVTLSTDSDAAANEVIIVSYDESDTDDGDTFASLSAADIEALYNDDEDIDNLLGTDFEQVESNAVVDGNGKAILMVENANNLGEYKVFELSWDAATSSEDDDLSATLLGSLDFGDSLTDLAEVNLVGSDAYASLLNSGFDVAT